MKQFGHGIPQFQARSSTKLVDMATKLDAARLLNYRAATMLDRGERVTKESSMAKLFASEAAVRDYRMKRCRSTERVWVHQGIIKLGGKFYRDVELCTIGEGTARFGAWVIARRLLKDCRRLSREWLPNE